MIPKQKKNERCVFKQQLQLGIRQCQRTDIFLWVTKNN